MSMQLGDIGLGRMGANIASRLAQPRPSASSIAAVSTREGEQTEFEMVEGDPKLVERCNVAPKVAQLKTTSEAGPRARRP
jgi:6-phosphogluconate dehydrogenase (decarboxylating)